MRLQKPFRVKKDKTFTWTFVIQNLAPFYGPVFFKSVPANANKLELVQIFISLLFWCLFLTSIFVIMTKNTSGYTSPYISNLFVMGDSKTKIHDPRPQRYGLVSEAGIPGM